MFFLDAHHLYKHCYVICNTKYNLNSDISNACAVKAYVESKYKCVREPLPGETTPTTPPVTVDPWTPDPDSNMPPPDENYDESKRKPIWWYHTDHLGSSTYLTDNFGRPTHYYDNMPFGETMVEHNQSKYGNSKYDNAYKFNGKELDASTGMYYYGARYYDPRISIFVSVDPLAEETMTPYQYVGNNPVNMVDPTGMNHHDYKLNSDGSLKLLNETTDDFDRIFREDGKKSITVSKSFLWGENPSGRFNPTLPTYGKKAKYNLTNAEVESGKGREIFKFFARNTTKEWDYNEFSDRKTDSKFGYLSTSHQSNIVKGSNALVKSVLDSSNDIMWLYSEHSHPNARTMKDFLPSGWSLNTSGEIKRTIDGATNKPNGDRGFYDGFRSDSKYNRRMPRHHHVFSPYLNKTIRYDNESFNFIK